MESVILHPLPLIAISDYVVRHTLRGAAGPVVGALFGQQNNREVTLEFAFELQTLVGGKNSQDVTIDPEFLTTRLDQMRQVHKDRNLDLVGWFTLLPRSGPGPHHLPIHYQLLNYNESAVLLGLHTDAILEGSVGGGKLPITVYESYYEVDRATVAAQAEDEDKEMKDGDAQLKLRFRELPYSVETGEAEMISLDCVAAGANNAASMEAREREQKPVAVQSDVKGKRRAVSQEAPETASGSEIILSKEDEEMIAALTAKANAIKMLKSRIELLTAYLQKLHSESPGEAKGQTTSPHKILRLAQGLVHRLSLIEPSNVQQFKEEMMSETNNVNTVALLTDVMSKLVASRDIGKKSLVIDSAKSQRQRYDYSAGGTGIPPVTDLMH